MEIQTLLKQWKFSTKKDYLTFLDSTLNLLKGNTVHGKVLNALNALLQQHLRENTSDDAYIEKYLEFIIQMENIELLVDFLQVLESITISLRILKKIVDFSTSALESSDYKVLNVLWKAMLKIITRDIKQELKYYLFKNAFVKQLKSLDENIETNKFYGLIAFYLGHLNAFVKFSTNVLVGEEEMIIGFLVSTGYVT